MPEVTPKLPLQVAGSAEAFKRVDYEYPAAAASAAKAAGVKHFSLVTAQGGWCAFGRQLNSERCCEALCRRAQAVAALQKFRSKWLHKVKFWGRVADSMDVARRPPVLLGGSAVTTESWELCTRGAEAQEQWRTSCHTCYHRHGTLASLHKRRYGILASLWPIWYVQDPNHT